MPSNYRFPSTLKLSFPSKRPLLTHVLVLRTGRLSRFLKQERDDVPIISTCLDYIKHNNEKEAANASSLLNGTLYVHLNTLILVISHLFS